MATLQQAYIAAATRSPIGKVLKRELREQFAESWLGL